MSGIDAFKEKLQVLVSKFEKDKHHYLSKGYPEAQVRIDFLNPLFEALGWDIENKAQKPPHERDVIVELSPETSGNFLTQETVAIETIAVLHSAGIMQQMNIPEIGKSV